MIAELYLEQQRTKLELVYTNYALDMFKDFNKFQNLDGSSLLGGDLIIEVEIYTEIYMLCCYLTEWLIW